MAAASTVPSVGKAVIINEAGESDKLVYTESHPVPKPGPGEILVKNDYAGVNFIDIKERQGAYPLDKIPYVLGWEAVGTVVDANASSSSSNNNNNNEVPVFKEGDRVLLLAEKGAYSEYTICPAARVIKVPEGVNEKEALGGCLMGLTALTLVQEAYPVKKGDKVLLHAAAGAMGLLLCQILRNLGAYTIGTAGSPERCQLAKDAGANEVIDYTAHPGDQWVKKVLELTGGEGVDVVFDSVGKSTWEGSLDAVRRAGKVVYWGNSSGPVPPINISRLAPKSLSIQYATMPTYIGTRQKFEGYLNQVFDLIRSGKLKIKIHKIYDLRDAKQAHDDLEGRKTSGKLLLRI